MDCWHPAGSSKQNRSEAALSANIGETVLATAYAAHPERFPGGLPYPRARPVEVWINPPKTLVSRQEPSKTQRWPLAHEGAFA